MCQCKECSNKEMELLPEFEGMFGNEFESLYPEMEFKVMNETVSKNSVPYIKWVQGSLNKILGLNLLVDGDAGPKTRSAIRSFQAKNGLEQVGYVGPKTEAAILKAGAQAISTSSSASSSSGSVTVTNIVTLKNNIVTIALGEWKRWGYGKKTEDEKVMQTVIEEYWKKGVGYLPDALSSPWSAAFISYVMRIAGSGNSFPYSSNHSIYSYRAKNNRIANVAGSFMAYHISELKPQIGDIIVAPRDSSLSYATLSKEGKKGHGDIIVEINADGVYVVGGNVGNSTSGKRGVTVNRKKPIRMSTDGYLTGTDYDIIIRAGGASLREIRSSESELEILSEYEMIFNEINYSKAISQNEMYSQQLGWIDNTFDIEFLVGFTNSSPTQEMFVEAVADWQRNNGLVADGVIGPKTWASMKLKLKSIIVPKVTSTPSSGAKLGSINVNINGINKFNYQFTNTDLEWTLKFIEGETGVSPTTEAVAVFWAMVNRFGIKMSRAPLTWSSFSAFLRAYSTTLQPILKNKRAAYRHQGSSNFVNVGNDFYPINDAPAGVSIRKGQLKRHLAIQAKQIISYSQQMISFAQNCLNGNISNPGIGFASEFGNTATYFRDVNSQLCQQPKSLGQLCPTIAEWETFNWNVPKRNKYHSTWKWVGNINGLKQYNINTFFLNYALLGNDSIQVSIV